MYRLTWLFIIFTLICAFYAAPSRRLPLLLFSPGAMTSTASGIVFEGDIVAFECTIGDEDDKELNSDAFIQSLVKFSGAAEYACMKTCNELKDCATHLGCSSCTRVIPQTCRLSFVVGLQHDGLSIRCGFFDGARNSSSNIITLKVVPRQLKFSVSVDSPPFSGSLLLHDWNGTERDVLEHPPASSRLLRPLTQPGAFTLFVQGDHVPYRLPAEPQSDEPEPPVCPALSTQYLQLSLISPIRHLLLCNNQQPTPDRNWITLELTCDAIVSPWLRSDVRFLWLLNGKVSSNNVNTRKIHTFAGLSEQASIHRESWILDIPTRNVVTRIECRVFVNDTVLVPCCSASTHESVCQPVTGFARVVLDVVDATPGSSAAHWCAPGAELDPNLQINDECPTVAAALYCQIQTPVLSPPPSQEVKFTLWEKAFYEYAELFLFLSISLVSTIFFWIIPCIKRRMK